MIGTPTRKGRRVWGQRPGVSACGLVWGGWAVLAPLPQGSLPAQPPGTDTQQHTHIGIEAKLHVAVRGLEDAALVREAGLAAAGGCWCGGGRLRGGTSKHGGGHQRQEKDLARHDDDNLDDGLQLNQERVLLVVVLVLPRCRHCSPITNAVGLQPPPLLRNSDVGCAMEENGYGAGRSFKTSMGVS